MAQRLQASRRSSTSTPHRMVTRSSVSFRSQATSSIPGACHASRCWSMVRRFTMPTSISRATMPKRKYPNFFGGGFPYDPGFATSFLASNYSAGDHVMAIRVTYSNSEIADLGTLTVHVDPTKNQAPIGALDSPHGNDVPGEDAYVTGVYPITGWAIDDQGVRQRVSPTGCTLNVTPGCEILADIDIMIDGRVIGEAFYPLPRPDVANAYPDVAGAFQSGFQMNLDSTHTPTASTRCRCGCGTRKE